MHSWVGVGSHLKYMPGQVDRNSQICVCLQRFENLGEGVAWSGIFIRGAKPLWLMASRSACCADVSCFACWACLAREFKEGTALSPSGSARFARSARSAWHACFALVAWVQPVCVIKRSHQAQCLQVYMLCLLEVKSMLCVLCLNLGVTIGLQ